MSKNPRDTDRAEGQTGRSGGRTYNKRGEPSKKNNMGLPQSIENDLSYHNMLGQHIKSNLQDFQNPSAEVLMQLERVLVQKYLLSSAVLGSRFHFTRPLDPSPTQNSLIKSQTSGTIARGPPFAFGSFFARPTTARSGIVQETKNMCFPQERESDSWG